MFVASSACDFTTQASKVALSLAIRTTKVNKVVLFYEVFVALVFVAFALESELIGNAKCTETFPPPSHVWRSHDEPHDVAA
jgi:hypothetical protein